jgi:hypothetical protein
VIDVKGFVFVAALILLAATILAQPILLEINTNFTAHKLEPGKNFASENLRVTPEKSLKAPAIFKIGVPLVLESVFKPLELENPFTSPEKSFSVEVTEKKVINFASPFYPENKFSEEINVVVPLAMVFPKIQQKETKTLFASAFKEQLKFKVEDLNVKKAISISIPLLKSSHKMKSSLAILEMKKKVSAYSPLGGLETIGKYLEENKYAFWMNQDYLGMNMDTPLISNWVAYDYHTNQISKLSLSFNAGPFSSLLSMKNGNVSAFVRTGYGIMVGASISPASTISVYSTLPITIGDFESVIGGEYVINSSPTIFRPSIMLRYKFGDFSPYTSYSYENATPIVHVGLMKNEFDVDGSMTLEDVPNSNVSFKYFSPFGVFESGVGLKDKTYSGTLRYSSKPFGFDIIQFTFDSDAYVNSLGNYEVSGKIGTTFKLFFSYVDAWVKGTFNGIKPAFTYGMEVGF